MKLPNADHAYVDVDKLTDYCLDPVHPRGRHKARVFESALGLTAAHAYFLRDCLLRAAHTEEAIPGRTDAYGQRYVVEFDVAGPKGTALVRSAWIVRQDEDFPRFVSCYVA